MFFMGGNPHIGRRQALSIGSKRPCRRALLVPRGRATGAAGMGATRPLQFLQASRILS